MTIVAKKTWPSVEWSSWYFRFGLYVIIHLIILLCWQSFCSLWLVISWKYCLQTHFHGQKRILHQNFFRRKRFFWMVKPGRQNCPYSWSICLVPVLHETPKVHLSEKNLMTKKKKKWQKILSHSTILTVSQERMCHLEISLIKCPQHLFDFFSIFDTGFF